jgi:hypothetical protein
MIPVDLSLRYSNVKGTVTCKLQRSHVKRRVCPIVFRWRVRNRLFNRHDKSLVLGEEGAHSTEFARYELRGRDAAYYGTDLPTFQWHLLASSKLVEIYRPLEAGPFSRLKYPEYEGGTDQSSGENLS